MFDLSCHCGKVTLTVQADAPAEAISCNCSHCRRKGLLLAFFPRDRVSLDSGDGDLTSYLFNKHAIEHRFCSTCGCQPFAEGKMPDGTPIRAVNLRCAPGIALDTLTIQDVDGASF